MEIPVYLFTGFLESGKTKFIQETLEDSNFGAEETTLLLICEEGIEEYQPNEFAVKNVFTKVLENEEEINSKDLDKIVKEHKIKRVMIEYNGMWSITKLYNEMPKEWVIYQEIMFCDSNTAITYNSNMRSLMVDKLQGCELCVFNRYDESKHNAMALHKIVRGISRRASIIFEDINGNIRQDEIEDPLPFDVNATIVHINDEDYALFYRDFSENIKGYIGKTVNFTGMIAINKKMDDNSFVIGRQIMTCCEADIAYRGFACTGVDKANYKSRQWLNITAKIVYEYNKIYANKGPVMQIISVDEAKKPEQEVATFY